MIKKTSWFASQINNDAQLTKEQKKEAINEIAGTIINIRRNEKIILWPVEIFGRKFKSIEEIQKAC